MKIGELDVSKLYLGGAEIEKIYLGTSEVYEEEEPTHDYSQDYLTFESTSNNNTIYWRSSSSNAFKTISASTDNGSTWTEYTSSYNNGTTIATLNSGDTIIFKGENAQYDSKGIFKSTSSFIAYGNIMSLVYGDNFSGQTTLTSGNTFGSLFSQAGLTSAENLILPATTLAQGCYQSMFAGCTSLTVAPELPATTLEYRCYSTMFQDCTSLTTAPSILPATTLSDWCYTGMFHDCTSLTTAPELPASTLSDMCYTEMFYGCTNLNYIKCLATDISAMDCTISWLEGVTEEQESPTFVRAASMNDWECGIDGIPDRWVVYDEYGDEVDSPCSPDIDDPDLG